MIFTIVDVEIATDGKKRTEIKTHLQAIVTLGCTKMKRSETKRKAAARNKVIKPKSKTEKKRKERKER